MPGQMSNGLASGLGRPLFIGNRWQSKKSDQIKLIWRSGPNDD